MYKISEQLSVNSMKNLMNRFSGKDKKVTQKIIFTITQFWTNKSNFGAKKRSNEQIF